MPRRGINWAVEVLRRIKGLEFPVTRDQLRERLKDFYYYGIPATRILEEVEKESFASPAELLRELAEAIRRLEERGELPVTARRGINWAAEVLKRIRGLSFPATREQVRERLAGLTWHGVNIERILEEVEKESFASPAELLKEIAEAISRGGASCRRPSTSPHRSPSLWVFYPVSCPFVGHVSPIRLSSRRHIVHMSTGSLASRR